jgi:F-type H+-transporting ATPase subunit a
MVIFSPLEQFQISTTFPLTLSVLDFSITNFSLSVFVLGFFILMSFIIAVNTSKIFNVTILQTVVEFFYTFVSEIMIQQAGKKGLAGVPFAFTLFVVIFLSNFFGLFAVGFTLTSQIAVTAALAFSINIGLFILSLQLHGLKFFRFFVPTGIPVFLVPFMVVIEIFSYSIRSISLFVRLFANMMAGHTLLHIIGSFFLVLFWNYNYYIAFVPLFLLIAIFVLEIAIAFLQAYVFLTLFCIYLNDALTAGH